MNPTGRRWRGFQVTAVFLMCLLGPVGRGITGQVLIGNTFLGSSGVDYGQAIAVDTDGNVYVTGTSTATWGSPIRAFSGNAATFVAKLAPNGSLIWNTFLGGSGYAGGWCIEVDADGNAYVVGYSNQSWGNPNRMHSGSYDGFAAKLDGNGNLVWNTFLGASGAHYCHGIALDGVGNAYVVGTSGITWGDSPIRAHSGDGDGFVAKLDGDGQLMWNTFLGGAGNDYAEGIAVDGDGVYVAGNSDATWGSPVRAYSYGGDAFAARLNTDGGLVWTTFLGGNGYDQGSAIGANGGGVYVAGYGSASWGSPVRAFSGARAAFVVGLDSNGSLAWSTFLGGEGYTYASGIAVAADGRLHVSGYSDAAWGNPVRPFFGGNDAFLAQLDGNGELLANTFLGGDGNDYAFGIALDAEGNAHVVGNSDATWDAPLRAHAGGADAFVARLGAGGVMYPSGGIELDARRPEFSWPATEGATWYQLWIALAGQQWQTPWVQGATTWKPAADMPPGNYTWWMRPWGPALGFGAWSEEAADFTILLRRPTAAPGQIGPSGDVTDTRRPTFEWTAVARATWYRLYVTRDGSVVIDRWVQGLTEFTPDADLPPGTYRWWIVGWGPAGYGPWSGAMDFALPARLPGAIVQIAPEGAQTENNLTYRWAKDAHATWYRLWVGRTGAGTWHDRWYNLPPNGLEAEVPLAGHPAGSFTWWLRPWGPDGYGPWSGPMAFSSPGPDPAKPELIAPTGTIFETQPTFEWHPAARATWYRVYVQRGTTKVIDTWTQDTELPSPSVLALGDYAWWVGAWNAVTEKTVWSDRMDFTLADSPSAPDGMGLIPGGTNVGTNPLAATGDGYNDLYPEEYSLTVDSFYMDQYEVTKVLWDQVHGWAVTNGYNFDNSGSGKGEDHPAQSVNWYDAVKWCNARSEREGLPPVYTVDGAVYRTNRSNTVVQDAAPGYRLPTDAEWEYAARSGLNSRRFPWGDTIQHTQANYYSHEAYSYDTSSTRGFHPDSGTSPRTVAVGSFAPNGYGLFDMAGNVYEWCFDWHPSFVDSRRVRRGGGHDYYATACRAGTRSYMWPDIASGAIGFRTVRSPGP